VLEAFLIVSRALDQAVTRWADAAELSVFLSDDADAASRARSSARCEAIRQCATSAS
jgi:cell division protein FtsX